MGTDIQIPGVKALQRVKFRPVAPSICGSSLCDLLHVARLILGIFKVASRFFENQCIPFVGNVICVCVCGTDVGFGSPFGDPNIAAVWDIRGLEL